MLAETEEGATALTHEALDVLERASSIVTPDHPEASKVETNLATALRRSAAVSEDPRHALERVIASRLRALRDETSLSPQQRGNAHDSLGNDYSSCAASGPCLDEKTFRLGLASYRRALRHRPKTSSPIDWARTQSNIAAHHGRACQLSMGAVAKRRGRAALARIDMAMSVLDRDNAPHDWSHGCRHMTAMVLLMMEPAPTQARTGSGQSFRVSAMPLISPTPTSTAIRSCRRSNFRQRLSRTCSRGVAMPRRH